MDTKWNNLIEVVFDFFIKKKRIISGSIITVYTLGVIMYYTESTYLGKSPSFYWMMVFLNVLLVIGLVLLLKEYLDVRFKKWTPATEAFYEEWKHNLVKTERMLLGVFAGLYVTLFLVFAYMQLVTPLTLFINFLICQSVLMKFMLKKLDLYQENQQEINEKKLEVTLQEALEIERKSLEKVSKSDQLRMDLVTNVSHDLKTPLTSMVGYVELLKKEELGDVAKDYVEVISDKMEKMKEMIGSLFSLAKVSSGNIELKKEKFEVNRLLEQILADLKDKIDQSDLIFVKQFAKESTEIISDNMYFYRVCQNLLENALKYSADKTRVFVKTYVEDKICIEITNTAGYFMDFEKEDILEKFARGDKERSTEGNGLGLAIVSSYTKALRGEFDILIDCDQFKACLKFPKE